MKRIFFSLSLLLTAALLLSAQTPLPRDPEVRMGKLKNGLTYYIRHNDKEPGLADFYIAQRVGSIQEEPRQRGLAHFLEHMAFNGTKHFPGQGKRLGIVPWCETIGVKFGANLNAYTSVDQTVYHIGSAPLKREGILDSCLLVLHDWSHYLLLDDKEIDKERGVIHEEWRTRRAGRAVSRLMEQAMPKVYKGTKYEDCMPIGSMDIVDNFPYQDLRDYYHKWYRPDLQAVVVVGDIDVDKVEKKIRKLFSPIPLPKERAERIYYPVSDNDSMLVCIEKDAEQPIVLCHLYMKRDATPDDQKDSEAYLRSSYVDQLVSYMVNDRLTALKQQAQPPFQSATGRASAFFLSRTKEAFSLSVSCRQESILGGLMTAVAACEQMRQQGFTQAELDRAKAFRLNHNERKYHERHDRTNAKLVSLCVQHFLTGEPLISIDKQWELTQKFDREVTLDDVNRAVRALITDRNQVVVMYAPDKPSVPLPTEQQIEDVILTTQQGQYATAPLSSPEGATIGQYVDSLLFIEAPSGAVEGAGTPGGAAIVSERPWHHGFTELVLSNGMQVYVRQTDYSRNTLQLKMKAHGGTSLYGDADIPQFPLISSSISEGGVGPWDALQLRHALNGKSVRVQPSVGSRSRTITGGASLKDAETMFQLVHLYFTQPRRDTAAFASLVSRTHSFLTNRNASPRVDYNDSLTAILYGHHPRLEPMTQARLLQADYDRILTIYKELFSRAADFQTVIIGNMSLDELRPMIVKYLATLPNNRGDEGAEVPPTNTPQLLQRDTVCTFTKKMATPLASVTIVYAADVAFTPRNDLVLDFLKRCLAIAYTDSVREEKGGTYGVSVDFALDRDDDPTATLRISYHADPSRYAELNPLIYRQLRHIAERGPQPSSMQKVSEYLVKQYRQASVTNDYWDYVAWHQLDDAADFDRDYCQLCREVTAADVQQMARRILQSGCRIEVTMLSE